MKKNLMIMIAVFLTVLLLSVVLFSCAANNNSSGSNGSGGGADDQNARDDSENGKDTEIIKPDVPDEWDFEGYEFMILANGKEYNSYWYSKDIYAEEETGDLINDAVYTRNRKIEEKYNVSIKGTFAGNQYNEASKDILSGNNVYDMYTVPLQGATAQLAQGNMLTDLKTIPYIDLKKPWWDQRANQQLSINNKLMFTISDLLIIDKDALFIFFFNKDVIDDYNMENPYQIVAEDKWTIDKMWDMAKVISRDINGDGVMDDADAYGLLTAGHTIHGNIVSSGHFVISKNNNDLPVLNIKDPVIQSSYEKWISIINDRSNTWVAQDWASKHTDIWMYQLDVLNEKRGLWLYAGMDRVTTLRVFECNFGILPNPKYDESQSEYYNHVHAWCTTAISVPITSDLERTGMILEALTAESYYTLRPAYYDVSLKNKFMRDNESGEMLDLIFMTRCYDLGHVYNWGGIFDMFHDLPLQKNQDFVSAYEKILPKVEADMQKSIDDMTRAE